MSYSEMKQPPQNYGSGQPSANRYLEGQKAYNGLLGEARVLTAGWRLVAGVTLFLCIVLVYGLVSESSKSKIVPYMVRVIPTARLRRQVRSPTIISRNNRRSNTF